MLIWVLLVQTAIIVRVGTNMKTRELSIGEKEAIVKLREDGKSIRAIAKELSIASTTIWNVLKKKETTGVLSNRHRTGRPRKTTAADDRNIVRAVKKDPKTTVGEISNNLQRAGVKVSASTVHRRLHEQKYRGYTRRCKPLISKKNRKARLDFAKRYRDEPQKFWDKVLWTDETKMNLYQSDGKAKVWRKKGSAHDPKHTSSSVKHGGGNVMAWACMASSGTGSLIFIDDVTHDGSSKMNSEVYRNILSANLKKDATKLIGRSFIMQQDNDPKHTAKTTKEFIRGKNWRLLDWPSQSPDLNPIEHAFYLLKRRLKGGAPQNKQQLKEAAVKAWKSITKEECKSLVMSVGQRLDAVIASKGFATKY